MNKKSAISLIFPNLLTLLVSIELLAAQGPPAPDGARLFSANCAACHGSDGASGERAPDIATRREVVARADADLTRIVRDGIPGTGMPGFGYLGEEKVNAIVKHLLKLQGAGSINKISGDPRRGQELFHGKAECSRCHMVNGRGGFLAADLSGYGAGHSAAEIRDWIMDPDRKLDRTAELVTVTTSDGAEWVGAIRSEDNFSLVLQTGDGVFRFFYRNRVACIEYSGHSWMPRDYKTRLTGAELDDLVGYLLATKKAEITAAGKDEDE
jgi:cytochrome c oxidase cbb3-type subunit III